MKTLTKTIAVITFSLATIGMANAATVVAADNSVTTKLCVAAAQGSKIRMHIAVKDSHLSKSFIVDKIQCNDKSFLSFVAQYAKNPEKITYLLTNGKVKGKVNISDLTSL